MNSSVKRCFNSRSPSIDKVPMSKPVVSLKTSESNIVFPSLLRVSLP